MEKPESDLAPSDGDGKVPATGRGRFQVFGLALLAGALLWLAFPPVGWAWLAWLAPTPLVWLVRSKTLPGRRPYLQLFVAGLFYWLGTFYFIPLPHPLLWIGWLLVSLYMALYTPMFVGVSRTLVHQLGAPGLVVIPLVWTGIEWIRCNFATGMAMVCLSHSQYKSPILIQVADLSGAYTLTFAIMVVAVGLSSLAAIVGSKWNADSESKRVGFGMRNRVFEIGVALVAFLSIWFYGQYRLQEQVVFNDDATLTVGLIQTSNDVVFRQLSEQEYWDQLFEKFQQTWQARTQWNDLELIVWPESGFLHSDYLSDGIETVESAASMRTQVWSDAIGYPKYFSTPVPLLTGGGTRDPENDKVYGSAFLIANDGQIETRYFKIHLVMFGEYVPLADWLPWIKKLSPIGGGVSSGQQFEVVTRNTIKLAPSICFESTIPHFIRRQINRLAAMGNEPDAMVNMTNDGWFNGTSCLDLHLACNVFRAVEMRKTHLVCANTGFSAEIDNCGRLVQTGPRRQPAELRCVVRSVDRSSLYRKIGDLVPMIFGGIVVFGLIIGWLNAKGFSLPFNRDPGDIGDANNRDREG